MKSLVCALLVTSLTITTTVCADQSVTTENDIMQVMNETPVGTAKKITITGNVIEKDDIKAGKLYCLQIGSQTIPGLPASYGTHTGKTVTVEITVNHCPMFTASQKAGLWVGEVHKLVKVN